MQMTLVVRGETVTFDSPFMLDREVINELQRLVHGPLAQNHFAVDLVQKGRRAPLSPKQMAWARYLCWKETAPAEEAPSVRFLRIAMMLEFARQNGLKRPILRGDRVTLKLRFNQKRQAFLIYVEWCGDYVGFLDRLGSIPEESWRLRKLDGLLDELAEIERNPVEAAHGYGQRTGACCFCKTPLTTNESVTAGYGPICAAKYGLPWGDTSEPFDWKELFQQMQDLTNRKEVDHGPVASTGT